jgi:4-amino-4-deoxy-L-arabinose transferase-like glycosyltransferase
MQETLRRIKQNFPALIFLCWMIFMLGGYYAIQRPLEMVQIKALIECVYNLILAVSLVAFAGGVGQYLLGETPFITKLEGLALKTALGIGLMGIGMLVFGSAGLLRVWVAWGGLVIGIFFFRRDILTWCQYWKGLIGDIQSFHWLTKLSIWFIMLILVINLLLALAPPVKWDSLTYHLTLPKLYVESGNVNFIQENSFSGYPQNVEMIFTWAFALNSGVTAVTVGWVIGIIGLIGVVGFIRRLLGDRFAWLGAAILLSGQTLAHTLHWGFVGYWLVIFGYGLTLGLDIYYQTGKRRFLVLAGLMVGFALGTKYTAGILVPIAVAVMFYECFKQDSDRKQPWIKGIHQLIYDLIIFGVFSFLAFAPWMIKNLISTGNPIFPLFFKGMGMDDLRWLFYSQSHAEEYIPGLRDGLLLPIQITVFSLDNTFIVGFPAYFADIGPLLIGLIPGLLLGWGNFNRQKQNTISRLLVMVGTAWVVWAFAGKFYVQGNRTRHYFGVFPALAALSSAGYKTLSDVKLYKIQVQHFVSIILAIVFVISGLRELFHFVKVDPFPVLLGYQSEDEFLEKNLYSFGSAMVEINQLPPGSNVAFLWEPRGYYCRIPCNPDEVFDAWWYWRRTSGDSKDIAETLRNQGVSHILLYNYGPIFWKEHGTLFEPEDWVVLDHFLANELDAVADFGDLHALYRLK